MIKQILKYCASEAFTKGLNKLLILLLPIILNVDNFGIIGIIISIELLLPFITLLGFERAILRFYNNPDFKLKSLLFTILETLKYTHLLLILGCIIFYFVGINTIFGLQLLDIFLIVILVYFQSYNRIILMMYRVEDNHKKYFQSKTYLQVSKFILILLLCYLFKDYKGYLIGSLVVSFIINIIYRSKGKNEDKFNLDTFKYILYFSWPFIFHGISMNLLGNADKFIIQKFLGFNDVGQYTFAYSISSMILFAFIGISIYLEPKIYQANDIEKREKMLDQFLIITLITGLLFYIFICISTFFIPYIYSEGYDKAIKYIPYLSMAYLLYPFYLVSNYKMIYDRKSKTLAIVSISTCLISLGLNYLLIPVLGLEGAILINIVSYYLQINLFVLISNKFRINNYLIENLLLGAILIICCLLNISFYISILLMVLYIIYLLFYRKKINNLKYI